MTPPGSHPTSGFGARHGPPKFFGQKNAASYKTMRQIGGPRGIRTLDLSDANRTLSHADLKEAPKGRNISFEKWQKT